MAAWRYVVRGRVQGVGYRYFALQVARELGVTGFVRNVSDGSVEVVAEADDATLAAFEARLREGPSFGRVEDLERQPVSPRGDAGFHVR
jgi:acylphosphatase